MGCPTGAIVYTHTRTVLAARHRQIHSDRVQRRSGTVHAHCAGCSVTDTIMQTMIQNAMRMTQRLTNVPVGMLWLVYVSANPGRAIGAENDV